MQIENSHLTYCTNIHPGETWPDHFTELKKYFPTIKQAISPHQPMGIGLRLANAASIALQEGDQIAEFKDWLAQQDAYVFTINGFPYGGFHHTVVKDQVHSPDWTSDARRNYTKRLANILSQLLPAGMDGGISTSPLSYRHWFRQTEMPDIIRQATSQLIDVALHLMQIQRKTGQVIHLDIEPEPDGMLETGAEFIQWYEQYLLPQAILQVMESLDVDATGAENLLKSHVRLCYDVCHFAIGYEPHESVLNMLQAAGIRIGKFQISAALKSRMPVVEERQRIIGGFASYQESTYLHQVVAQTKNGQLLRYPDLPQALADAGNQDVAEWRAHFHVPVFTNQFGILQSTQEDITQVLRQHQQHHPTRHLEVETYTWEVLPDTHKLPIDQSIIRELDWVKQQLLHI
ncbi:hypothetical protein SAMN05216436_11843 [bacterium A37T11]|nr:hypothetical protein SAMN05216436_11843 [bacterium A37T11]